MCDRLTHHPYLSLVAFALDLRAKHPALAAFLEAATTALVRVEIEEAATSAVSSG